ncbi:MAG: ferredoxin [Saprospiraceae bacterium]|nr:ferredoxin [Saprospiraceae bacterium]
MEETHHLLGREMQHFSALLASNKPVKVVAINLPSEVKIHYTGEEDELPSFQQELSSIAISHRSAFTLQAALHNPLHLVQGLDAGLTCATPALFHILMPDDSQTPARQFMHISSAVEGRQFPLFTYDASREKWGSRFDIDANPQAYLDWPEYTFEMLAETKEVSRIDLAFTFADYYAVNPANLIHLFDVPAHCWTADLIPLAEYLKLPTDQLYAKVPFIWMVDAAFTLHKMAVPYALVVAAKERLDFWNFIQELGGVSSFHVEQAVSRTRKEMLDQVEREVTELKARHELEIEKVRSTTAAEAMERLAGMLLDLDSLTIPGAVTQTSTTTSLAANPVTKTEVTQMVEDIAQTPVEVSNDAWVESYRCTSCNECTDKYPRAFRYNGDKQAYVADATTVTFAQLVKAAQACPAKCIHPGMPLNPKEPGLDALIELAKTLN